MLAGLARLGKTGLEGLETPENRPSEQDAALFSALLEESGGGKTAPQDEPVKSHAEDDGNALPVLPVAMPVPPPAPQLLPADDSGADTQLEEVAVGLGIDRSLARLLLTETAGAPPADTSIASVSTPDIEGFAATFAAAAPTPVASDAALSIGATSTDTVPTDTTQTVKPARLAADFAASLLAAVRPAGVDALPVDGVSAAQEPGVEAAAPKTAAASLTQLDLARLASSNAEISSIEVTAKPVTAPLPLPTAAPASSIVVPAALRATPAATAPVEAAPLGDEDVLRWRAMISRADASGAASAAPQDVAIEEPVLATVAADMVGKAKEGVLNRSTIAARDTRAGRGSGRGGELDGELLALGSLRNLVLDRVTPALVAQGAGIEQAAAALAPAIPATNPGFLIANPAIDTGLAPLAATSGASGGVMNEPL
ncbi:MAG: hypothetical protein EBR15_05095, partial [Gammaproteobacteria bacterium]|nr:hypothetical protein [Gammaproteobacteria bacterium]